MGTPNRPVTAILGTPAITFDPGDIGAPHARVRRPVRGLDRHMPPGTFLALASLLPVPRPNLAWITAQLVAGRPVCSPHATGVAPTPRHALQPLDLCHPEQPRIVELPSNIADVPTCTVIASHVPGVIPPGNPDLSHVPSVPGLSHGMRGTNGTGGTALMRRSLRGVGARREGADLPMVRRHRPAP
jgi:hypothetical protein